MSEIIFLSQQFIYSDHTYTYVFLFAWIIIYMQKILSDITII